MTVYKVSEVAEMLGTKPKHIYTYKARKKLIIVDGNIDDTLPINATFINSRLKKLKRTEALIPEDENKTKQKKKSKRVDVLDLQLNMEISENEKLRNKKLKEDIDLVRLKKEKIKGLVMQIDSVERVFNVHFKNISVEMYNAIDSYSQIITSKLGGKRKDLAEMRVILKEKVNELVNKSIIKSKEDLKAIRREYSDKKSVGES